MTPPARRGARFLVALLPLLLPPPTALAQDRERIVERAPSPAFHPWKAAYARRVARDRARLAPSERAPGITDPEGPASLRRPPREIAAAPTAPTALSTNTIVNSRAGDSPGSGQSETSIAALENVVVAAWNDGQGY